MNNFNKLLPRYAQSYTGQSLLTIIGMGVYNSAAPSLVNGQTSQLQLDQNGNVYTSLATMLAGEDITNQVFAMTQKPIVSSTYASTRFSNFGAATKANVKNSAGNLISVMATSINASIRFFQIHNKATAPAGADVPVLSLPIPGGSVNSPGVLVLDQGFFTMNGEFLSTGVGWAISTTQSTFTDSATAADHSVNGHYI